MLRVVVFFLITLLLGCSSNIQQRVVVLQYSEFGPQVIASEVIGMQWWQWQDHGDSRPRDYDVQVVVYRNTNLDEVKLIYPVIPEKSQDYRYLEYGAALRYLDEKIKDNFVEAVTADLRKTRYKLISELGD